jgi:hypothetical protein
MEKSKINRKIGFWKWLTHIPRGIYKFLKDVDWKMIALVALALSWVGTILLSAGTGMILIVYYIVPTSSPFAIDNGFAVQFLHSFPIWILLFAIDYLFSFMAITKS